MGLASLRIRDGASAGLSIESLDESAPCSAEQREDGIAERTYRMKQLSQNIQGLLLSNVYVKEKGDR